MRLASIAFLLASLAAPVFAQGDAPGAATITGTIAWPSGTLAASAPVAAKNQGTGVIYRATSNTTGTYTISELPPGTYELSVAVVGFRKFTRQSLAIPAGQTVRSDIVLEEELLDLTHLHLLLNHFPTIGTIIGLGLFLLAFATKSEDLKRASLMVFFGIALLTIPTYVSGNSAHEKVGHQPDVSTALIHTHEGAALEALVFIEITGIFAWLGLWYFRRRSRLPGWNALLVLLLALVSVGLVSRAANIGGEIRHPEIRASLETITPEGPVGREVGSFITSLTWIWATCETIHFIGLSLLFGVVLLIDLRLLGMMKGVPFTTLHRLLPWGILGFAVNLATGMIFFVAAPGQYDTNPAFELKLTFILLAAVNGLYLTVFDHAHAIGPGDDAPAGAKLVAGSTIFLWLGVIWCGTMLPFWGNAF